MDRTSESSAFWRVAGLVLVGLLVFLQIAAAVGSGGTYDTVRDIFYARAVATASEWPTTGPAISTIFHLGPLWYWLLAPGWVLGGMQGVVFLIGLMSAAKYLLAWYLGMRIGTERTGVFLVVGTALPGWAFFEMSLLTHVAVVQTTLLALALASLRCRASERLRDAAAVGLLAGLAFHAHPSSLLLAAVGANWAAGPPRIGLRYLQRVLLIGAMAALPLMPYVITQALSGVPDRAGIETYGATLGDHSIMDRISNLLRGVLIGGFEAVTVIWWRLEDAPRALATAGYAILLAAAGVGLALRLRRATALRALAGVCVLAVLAHACFLLAIREITPVWMVFGFGPPLAMLFALGCEGLADTQGARWTAAVVVAVVLTANVVSVPALRMDPKYENWFPKPPPGGYGLMDVGERPIGIQRNFSPRASWRELAHMARELCEPFVLHGHYASFIDHTHTVALVDACGDYRQVILGGPASPGHRKWLGLAQPAAKAIDVRPDALIGGLAVFGEYRIAHAGSGLRPVQPRAHPARHLEGTVGPSTLRFAARGDEAIIVVDAVAKLFGPPSFAVSWGGETIAPVYEDVVLAVYRCRSCAPQASFDVELTGVAAWGHVDVLVLPSTSSHGP